MTPEQRERKRASDRARHAKLTAEQLEREARQGSHAASAPAERVEPLFDRLMTIPIFIALDDASQDVLAEAIEAIVSEREEQR